MEPPEKTPTSGWWDEAGFWLGLHTLLDPLRVPYFANVLRGRESGRERSRVLDAGSGGGFVAAGLSSRADVVAVDPSLETIAEARAAGVPGVAVADVARLPFADGTFDAVICSEVLEHVADPEGAIAEAARVLAIGGRFLFSTPARTRWSRLALIDVAQRWRVSRVLPDDMHEWSRFLTRDELETLVERHGLRIMEIFGVGMKPRHVPGTVLTLALLKLGRITYAEAGRRIHLTRTKSTRIGMIGFAERMSPIPQP